jgi:ribosomal protein S18 acetylase RimI-like enzyme
MDPGPKADVWRQIIDGRIAPSETYVAEVAGDVAGFASVGRYRPDDGGDAEPDVGEVYAIYAEPNLWSTGIGRSLMDTAVAHLASAGFTEIRLWVFEDNPRARRFYERAGFHPDGETTTDVIGTGEYATEATEVRYAHVMP